MATALAACHSHNPDAILLFNGTGTSPGDVAAIESVLRASHVTWSTAGSRQLNAMSESQLRQHRLLIVPGGNFIQLGNGLTPHTAAGIRNAIRNGVNYLGICAGAFFAGNSPRNGLNLTSGVRFGFYSLEARGVRKAAVPITTAARCPSREHSVLWTSPETGPVSSRI